VVKLAFPGRLPAPILAIPGTNYTCGYWNIMMSLGIFHVSFMHLVKAMLCFAMVSWETSALENHVPEVVHSQSFGPNECVSLSLSDKGTCVMTTGCGDLRSIADTTFAFVCFNPGTSVPHALHSYGKGGFSANESYDTGVRCQQCTSVAWALAQGGLMSGSLQKHLESGNGTQGSQVMTQAEFYGPQSCISTYLSAEQTCLVKTNCSHDDIQGFSVGITCLDEMGGYTRYRFGGLSFKAVDVFDTRVRCRTCLGVGSKPPQQLRGVVPKMLVDDVNTLRAEVKELQENVTSLQQQITGNASSQAGTENSSSSPASVTNSTHSPSSSPASATNSTQSANSTPPAPSPSPPSAHTSLATGNVVVANVGSPAASTLVTLMRRAAQGFLKQGQTRLAPINSNPQ